jgi:hypothetical protein
MRTCCAGPCTHTHLLNVGKLGQQQLQLHIRQPILGPLPVASKLMLLLLLVPRRRSCLAKRCCGCQCF